MRKKKFREIRFCGCQCGGFKEVLVNSTWKYFAGHNLRVKNPMERLEAVTKMANTKRGRTKENHSGTAAQAEKMRGRTKENYPGVAERSKKMIGRKQSKEERVKRVKTRRNNGNPWHSEETKRKIGKGNFGNNNGMFGKCGELHPNWRGGIANSPYSLEFNEELKESIRQRDNYACQICKLTQEQLGKTLSIHHIDYNKENSCEDNLVSLCNRCHAATNSNRTYWIKVFKERRCINLMRCWIQPV